MTLSMRTSRNATVNSRQNPEASGSMRKNPNQRQNRLKWTTIFIFFFVLLFEYKLDEISKNKSDHFAAARNADGGGRSCRL